MEHNTLFAGEKQVTQTGYDYELVIPGNPRAQGRPRTRVVQAKRYIEELIRNIKVRISFIGHPNEPEDWSQEIKQMEAALSESKKKAYVTIYEDKKDTEAKKIIIEAIKNTAPEQPIDGPVRLGIGFYIQRPKGHFGTGKNAGIVKERYESAYLTGKPDGDNLEKLVWDALTEVFLRDDSCIVEWWGKKVYSDRPRTEIRIKIL